jgi:hypothetical protein
MLLNACVQRFQRVHRSVSVVGVGVRDTVHVHAKNGHGAIRWRPIGRYAQSMRS